MKIKGKKATISVTLPPEKVKKARRLGLNLSRILENALDEYLKRLEGSEIQTETNGGLIDARSASLQQDWWGRPDSNRGPESPSLRA
jgi:post-segregation antitoxin (ccd killing protein)